MSDSGIAVHNQDDPVADAPVESADSETLPPIPDGGLSATRPTWLQQAPGRPIGEPGPQTVDMASIAQSLELPPWLSALSERVGSTRRVEIAETAEPESVVEVVAELEAEEPVHGRPLGSSVLTAQQNAAERQARPGKPVFPSVPGAAPAKPALPSIPATAPVDAEEFLRGGEIAVSPEPRSKTPFIIAAVLIVVLAAVAVWYFAG